MIILITLIITLAGMVVIHLNWPLWLLVVLMALWAVLIVLAVR